MDSEAARDRCHYFEALFSPYINGDLDGPERKALAEHLHDCEQCAEHFGLTWRQATAKVVANASPSRRPVRSQRRVGLWLVMIASLAGVLALGATGLLDASEGDAGRLRPRGLVGEEVARMIAVQTELLKALVGPLRGTEEHVSHAARGAARDFFEKLSRASEAQAVPGREPAWAASFHKDFRASDPEPAGRDWDRTEFLGTLLEEGVPKVVLVRVHSAFRQVMLCTVTWGERPAFAWLLRDPLREVVPEEKAGGADTGPADAPFRLAYLLLSRP